VFELETELYVIALVNVVWHVKTLRRNFPKTVCHIAPQISSTHGLPSPKNMKLYVSTMCVETACIGTFITIFLENS